MRWVGRFLEYEILCLLFISSFCSGQQSVDSTYCNRFLIEITEDRYFKKEFSCGGTDAVLNIRDVAMERYKDSLSEYNVIDLYYNNRRANALPDLDSYSDSLRFLYLILGNARELPAPGYFSGFVHLETVQLNCPMRQVPPELFHIDLKCLTLILHRSTQITLPANYKPGLDYFCTNVRLTSENVEAIRHMNPGELSIVDLKNVKEGLSNLSAIKSIYISGKLTRKEQEKLKIYLPNAIYLNTR